MRASNKMVPMDVFCPIEGAEALLAEFTRTAAAAPSPAGTEGRALETKKRFPFETLPYDAVVCIENPTGTLGEDLVPAPLLDSALFG